MFKKILVPLDGSALAEKALPVAIHLAKHMQSELTLLSVAQQESVTVVEPMGYGVWIPSKTLADIRQELENYLIQTVKKYKTGNVSISYCLEIGDEAGGIVDTAVSQQTDLIIISTHGRSGFSRWLMGSITEKVLHQAPCPLLILRDDSLPQNIIITLDGSVLGETALLPGLALSVGLGADVTLLQVLEGSLPPMRSDDWMEDEETNADALETNSKQPDHATLYLQTIADRFPHHALKTAVPYGKPAEAILSYAENVPNSLIVIATHGRSGLARWVFGSVAEKVIRGTNRPVLVVRLDRERLR